MSIEFHDTTKSLSESLTELATTIPLGSRITLRELVSNIGEQGLLLFCLFLTVPFLIPVSIPGVSTVFGALIALIGIGITLNRVPWLPAFLMKREISAEHLHPVLEQGAKLCSRVDRLSRRRLLFLTNSLTINRLNGIALIAAAILLMIPSGIPFTNMLPGYAILFLAAGMLQRDGFFILLGYLLIVASAVYFGVLILGAVAVGSGLRDALSMDLTNVDFTNSLTPLIADLEIAQ